MRFRHSDEPLFIRRIRVGRLLLYLDRAHIIGTGRGMLHLWKKMWNTPTLLLTQFSMGSIDQGSYRARCF
jgi:hypothetical protein